jgi:hypothetical protein
MRPPRTLYTGLKPRTVVCLFRWTKLRAMYPTAREELLLAFAIGCGRKLLNWMAPRHSSYVRRFHNPSFSFSDQCLLWANSSPSPPPLRATGRSSFPPPGYDQFSSMGLRRPTLPSPYSPAIALHNSLRRVSLIAHQRRSCGAHVTHSSSTSSLQSKFLSQCRRNDPPVHPALQTTRCARLSSEEKNSVTLGG